MYQTLVRLVGFPELENSKLVMKRETQLSVVASILPRGRVSKNGAFLWLWSENELCMTVTKVNDLAKELLEKSQG